MKGKLIDSKDSLPLILGQVFISQEDGLPAYDDEHLNQIGKRYGVKFIGLGCVGDRRYEKYNLMIEQILNYKNGVDWKDTFWNEVAKTLDK